MASMVEEQEQMTASSTPNPGTSKWSFAPLQSIPRNSEALWNQVDSVYFSAIPQGHEILNALNEMLEPLSELQGFQPTDRETIFKQCEVVTLSYSRDIPESEDGSSTEPSQSTPNSISMVLSVDGDDFGVLSADSFLPWSEPVSRKVDKQKAPKVSSNTPDQFDVSSWKLVDLITESPMQDSSTPELELAFLKAELARVNKIKQETAKRILENIQNETRPNKKQWFDTEQAILNLYDKKPPSSFQSTAAATAAAVAPLTLNALGKVESELSDSLKDNELCCCICGEGDTTDDNDILICDGCSFAAHQHCYFVHDIPEGNWFCQLCVTFHTKKQSKRVSENSLSDLLEKTTCCLCLQPGSFFGGGLMKPVNPSSASPAWAHMKCASWVPEAAFPPDGNSITVIANKDREELRCSICKLKGGHPVQCAFGKCATAYHISCAAQAGLLPQEKSLKNLFCSRHIKIQLKMSPSTSRLLSLRKTDSYMKVVNDKLIAPKIGGSFYSPSYDPIVDARQAWVLQVLAFNPLVMKHLAAESSNSTSVLALEDIHESIPLVKDLNEIVSAENFNRDVFSDLNCCCECMRPFIESDIIVKCDSCNFLAHAICYDRAGVPAFNVDELASLDLGKAAKYDGSKWGRTPGVQPIQCVRCDIVKKSTIAISSTHCILCLQMGGIVLPVVEDEEDESDASRSPAFAHPRCLWWLSATSGVDLRSSPPQQVKSIAASYHFHPCAVCNSRQGCTVRCVRIGCNRRFHISCGFHAGACFTVRSIGDTNGIIAGSRDGSDEFEVLEGVKSVVNGGGSMRRTITCWLHEQRGTKRGIVQLGRVRPIVREIARWIPDGMRSQVVEIVNQALLGGPGDSGTTKKSSTRSKPAGQVRSGGSSRRMSRGADSSDSEYEIVGGKPIGETKRKRQKKDGPITTVRFVDGEEITCEDEDWEGGCALCGKAWTDSKGQILESIACDRCDQWFHFHCVGIEQAPSGEFVCPRCR